MLHVGQVLSSCHLSCDVEGVKVKLGGEASGGRGEQKTTNCVRSFLWKRGQL